ncbi:MAG: NADH:ubiquinone reductase (Na(+)-transporting) subunit B [Bacteroidales bacterium]|nr:NADH:ubiquinone reductase (Na(+)-transporting) subunit B [Bacteroidales bacterium]
MGFTELSDRIRKNFEKGRPLHCFSSLFDAIDTFLLTPKTVTTSGSHIRDAVDLKRIMITVMIALCPALLFGLWNTGYQHYLALGQASTFWTCFGYGFMKWLPLVIVTYISGLAVEVAFAQWRGKQVEEGFFVTGFLIPMIMPPDIPLWIVSVATIFSVFFAKEVFGGTGYNFLNPALMARAFVFFAYPSVISGNAVWVSEATEAITGATPLAQVMNGGEQTASFLDMFIGTIPGCIGETSKIAILIGATLLIYTQVASWRIMLSVIAGGFVTGALFHLTGLCPVSGWQHLLMGGFLFGAVFMATDPVTATHTQSGKYIYGLLIGILAIVIRVINKGYPEGMMLAILLMNIFAPLIDYCVIQIKIKKRKQNILLHKTQFTDKINSSK